MLQVMHYRHNPYITGTDSGIQFIQRRRVELFAGVDGFFRANVDFGQFALRQLFTCLLILLFILLFEETVNSGARS